MADPWVPPAADLDELRTAVQRCEGCDLFHDATQAVLGEGTGGSGLMLVGEQPGDHEDREGHPFVGPAGRVLDEALAAAGIESAYITNAVKHFRFEERGKRRIHQSPLRRHLVACRPWLDAELAAVRPRGVVLLGATAGQSLYGSSFRVGAARGVVRPWPEDGAGWTPEWTVATIHPSAVLRAREDRDDMYDGLVADLRTAADALRSGRRG